MRHRALASGAALVTLVVTTALAASPGLASSASAAPVVSHDGTPATAGAPYDPVAPHRAAERGGRAQRTSQVSRSGARTQAADDTDPLAVTIDQLTPSTMPTSGTIEVSGTVTNTDVDTWTTIKVYPFVSAEPMTTAAELEAATRTDPDAVVGERIVDETHNATIDSLLPGQTASFDISLPRGLLAADTPGVYWFGVQALGQGPDGRVDGADGRARTFLPLVPQRSTGRLPVSVVLPLRRPIVYADDGSLTDVDGWLQTLSQDGRLRSVVDLGSSAEGQPVSWLVDPALIDAVRRLAAGNPARSMSPNLRPGQDDAEPDASSSPSPTQGAPSGSDPPGPTTSTAAAGDGEPAALTRAQLDRVDSDTRDVALAAQDWLSRLTAAVRPGDELLVLPFGDTDVSAAAQHDERAYTVARARSDAAAILPDLSGVKVSPAVGSPSGFLSPEATDLLPPGTTTLVTEQMMKGARTTLASVSGHDLVVTSSGALAGGPGPDDPRAAVAMRQRLLSEAAVRFLGADPQPLVTVLPPDWNPQQSTGFFSGLDADWLDLDTVADTTATASPTAVASTALRYPAGQRASELDAANFEAASRLRAAGTALQSLLTLNNVVAQTVADEALGTVSYSARTHPDANRVAADRARTWIDARLREVTVSAPSAVTLSSSTGRFNSFVTNGLDQPVTVALDARTDNDLAVTGPRRVDVPARGTTTVPLGARTDQSGVHQVTLRVTDKRGVTLGSVTELSIRSTRVSGIIWLFLGLGALLLFGTIAVRLVRRVRGTSSDQPSDQPNGQADHPSSASAAPSSPRRDRHPVGDR